MNVNIAVRVTTLPFFSIEPSKKYKSKYMCEFPWKGGIIREPWVPLNVGRPLHIRIHNVRHIIRQTRLV